MIIDQLADPVVDGGRVSATHTGRGCRIGACAEAVVGEPVPGGTAGYYDWMRFRRADAASAATATASTRWFAAAATGSSGAVAAVTWHYRRMDSAAQRALLVARLRGGVNSSAIAAIADGTRL